MRGKWFLFFSFFGFFSKKNVMKKLVALMLVFAMASMASAGLQISVNGNPDPVTTEISLLPSETLELDIWTDADIPMFDGYVWMLVVDTTAATISGGICIVPGCTIGDPIILNPAVIPPPGMDGIWGSVFNLDMTPIPAGTVIADSFIIHGEGSYCDAVVQLWEVVEDVGVGVLHDQVIIHVGIPEPATMALLSLGGLFLLRRRK